MTVRMALLAVASCAALHGADAPQTFPDAAGIVAAHRGKVLVLLLGREDCPGTRNATKVLDDYAPRMPEGAAVVRVEVPLPSENAVKAPAAWNHPFPLRLDKGRALAAKLEFFYYPTLYICDRDGETRFIGGCDAQRLATMVSEIAAEKPGAPRKSYTLPLLAVGAVAPGVAGPGLDGQAVAWESLRGKRATFLFFGATTCPFSVGALAPLRELAAAFKAHGVAFVAVNRGEELETIKPVYAKAAAGLPVVWDKGGEQCTAYGVDAVPFFYLLDADAKVVMRRSFTPGAATAALNELLGMAVPAPRYAPSEAG